MSKQDLEGGQPSCICVCFPFYIRFLDPRSAECSHDTSTDFWCFRSKSTLISLSFYSSSVQDSDAPLRAAEPGHASQPGKPVLVDAAVQTDFAPCSHASQSRGGGGGGGGVSF